MQITQCPECHTAFKVSPEHLAVAKGWVRCGRCGGVFEALQHLESAALATSEENQNTASSSGDASDNVTVKASAAATTSENDIDAFHNSLMSFVPAAAVAAVVPAAAADEVPVFGKTPRATHQQSHRFGWLWGLLNVVLGVGLLLQVVFWNRHLLVAHEPALQGLIEGLCDPVGCEWHWPQTLDAVQIENSNFTENSDGTYRLQLRLKNTQHHAVAMPLLELTLTDEHDEVVLRRVFQPQELGLKDHMPALRDARSALNFDLNEDIKPRVVGFRALIFYP